MIKVTEFGGPSSLPIEPMAIEIRDRTSLDRWMLNIRWGRWMAAALLWSILGLLFALPGLSSPHWRQTLLGALAQWWSWGLITPLIFWTDARLPFKKNQLGMRILAHLPASVALTIVYFYVFVAMRAVLGLGAWSMLADTRLLVTGFQGLLWSWLVYWVIFGVRQTFRYYEHYLASELRLERMEHSFSQARLNALRMQLEPHFLFNALNTISSQVERDPRLARSMIEHLGDLLRLSLESKDKQEVPLAEEMEFLEHYLAIQKIRFGDHLKIDIAIEPEVKIASVPSLFLQPLVENAIRHGLSRRLSGGTVAISARRTDNRLKIRVLDDGVGLPPEWNLQTSAGLGLAVTQQRIAGLYPDGRSHFAIRNREGGGTEVEIDLPFRVAREDTHDVTKA
jgi:LytS/YehU family sensor histidine kinase